VFENRVLRRILGPDRDEVTREQRRRQNEELYDLCSSKYYLGDSSTKGRKFMTG
jgi:hypothetical protein